MAAPPVAAAEAAPAAGEGPDAERKARIRAAFAIFETDGSGTIPEEEVPTAIRYLDLFVPDRDFIDKVLVDLHGDEPKPFVRYDRFEAVVLKLWDAHAFDPDGPDVLLAAFRMLDPELTGWVDVDKMRALLCSVGDPPLREKELEAFFAAAVDKETGKLFYEDYVSLMSTK